MRRPHALFRRYPVDAHVVVAGEVLPSPYHIYDGSIMFIGGTADGEAVRTLLTAERLTPIVDQHGRALVAVWICDFTEANLDPHCELQISLFASFRPLPPVQAHPFAIYRALTRQGETRMVCHGLWNSTERVVRYNAEHLGLNARLARCDIDRGGGRWSFRVTDDALGVVAEGDVAAPARPSAAAMWALTRHIGLAGVTQSMRTPYLHVPVVNTRSRFAHDNLVAHTYTRSDRQVIRLFGAHDRVVIPCPHYASLGFVPDFVQQNDGVRFVYLRPQPDAAHA